MAPTMASTQIRHGRGARKSSAAIVGLMWLRLVAAPDPLGAGGPRDARAGGEVVLEPMANKDVLSRQTSPLIYDVGSRAVIGTSAGFGIGMAFFKRWPVRRFTTMFGLGVGLGLNYSQLNVLWHAARGTLDSSSQRNQEELRKELDDIHYEMKLRSKLKLN